MQLLSIPHAYAGTQTDLPADEGYTLLGKRHYHVNNGYLVPYYTRKNGEPLERRSEEMVVDRCRKFFHMAEPDIDLMWSYEAIEKEKALIETITDEREKAAHARMLVGAMVNRIERLARVFLQKGSTVGTRIDLTDEQQAGIDSISKTDDAETIKTKLEPLQREFGELYMYLTFDAPLGHVDLTRCVRMRGNARDNDDLLLDLVRETAKGFNLDDKWAERTTYSNIVNKIGWTLENIDQLHTDMLKLLKVNNAMPMLTAAHRKLYGKNASYHDTLKEFTDIARARACIKSEDYESFAPVLARLGMLEERLYKTHRMMRMAAREEKDIEAQAVRDLLDDGTKLMMRCAEARTPINEHSPRAGGIEGLSTAEKRAQSSTGRYEEQIDQLIENLTQRERTSTRRA